MENNWVKTSDRQPREEYRKFKEKYPDDNFEVIVQIRDAVLSTALIYDYDEENDEDIWRDETYNNYSVSHWMLLPVVP